MFHNTCNQDDDELIKFNGERGSSSKYYYQKAWFYKRRDRGEDNWRCKENRGISKCKAQIKRINGVLTFVNIHNHGLYNTTDKGQQVIEKLTREAVKDLSIHPQMIIDKVSHK